MAKRIHAYPRWRNANAKQPDVLSGQRNERARIGSERQRRWGRPAARASCKAAAPGSHHWASSTRAHGANRSSGTGGVPCFPPLGPTQPLYQEEGAQTHVVSALAWIR